jgi:exosortase
VLVLTAVFAVVLWVWWPTLTEMVDTWAHDSQYSHGFLVPVFSAYLLWLRGRGLDFSSFRPSWWGLPLFGLGLAIHFAGILFFITWLPGLALIPCLAGLFVLAGGRRAIGWAWPAIVFLVFMVPMSHTLHQMLAGPLQRIGTEVSTFTLQTLGFSSYSEGNIIHMGTIKLGVVEACSGLSMLLSFVALCSAVAIVVRRPLVDKIVIVLSAVPVAIICNVARITVTAILYKVAGHKLGDLVFHDLAGWLMMPLALGILWLEIKLLSRILVEPKKAEAGPVMLPGLIPGAGLKRGRFKRPAGSRRR